MFNSQGIKRWLAAAISLVVGVAQVIPPAAPAVLALQHIAAFFGVTGLLHATKAGTVTKQVLLSAQAALTGLVAASVWFAPLVPYHATLAYLATLLGTYVVGTTTKELFNA